MPLIINWYRGSSIPGTNRTIYQLQNLQYRRCKTSISGVFDIRHDMQWCDLQYRISKGYAHARAAARRALRGGNFWQAHCNVYYNVENSLIASCSLKLISIDILIAQIHEGRQIIPIGKMSARTYMFQTSWVLEGFCLPGNYPYSLVGIYPWNFHR